MANQPTDPTGSDSYFHSQLPHGTKMNQKAGARLILLAKLFFFNVVFSLGLMVYSGIYYTT